MSRDGCPPESKLLAFLSFELQAAEQSQLERHIEDCDQCATRIEELLNAEALNTLGDQLQSEHAEGEAEQNEEVPPNIPGFTHLECQGEGKEGDVYVAFEELAARDVAIKVLKRDVTADQLVKIEAERPAHPNVIPVFHCGKVGPKTYFTMQLAEGTLEEARDEIQEHFEAADVLEIMAGLANAVTHIHNMGIAHLDLKPANILKVVDEGAAKQTTYKISDFGLATALGTEIKKRIGTPHYRAPEIEALPANHITETPNEPTQEEMPVVIASPSHDIYGLGGIMFHLLLGETPPQSAAEIELKLKGAKDIPQDLKAVCRKCLSKTSDRYGASSELEEELDRCRKRKPTDAENPATPKRLALWAMREKSAAALTAVLFTLLVGVSCLAISNYRYSRRAKSDGRLITEQLERTRADSKQMQSQVLDLRDAISELERLEPDSPDIRALRIRLLSHQQLRIETLLDNPTQHTPYQLAVAEMEAGLNAAKIPAKRMEARKHLQRAQELWPVKLTLVLKENDVGLRKALCEQALIRLDVADSDEDKSDLIHRARELAERTIKLARTSEAWCILTAETFFEIATLQADCGDKSAHREAISTYQQALNCLDAGGFGSARSLDLMARCRKNMGIEHKELAELEQAKSLLTRTMEERRRLLEKFPSDVTYRDGLAGASHDLGALLCSMGRMKQGQELLATAIELRSELIRNFPRLTLVQKRLSKSLNTLASFHRQAGNIAESDRLYLEAIEIRERLFKSGPDEENRRLLAVACFNYANLLKNQPSSVQDAKRFYEWAIALLEHERDRLSKVALARACSNFAILLRDQGLHAKALELSDAGHEIASALFREEEADVDTRTLHAFCLFVSGTIHSGADGVERLKEAIHYWEDPDPATHNAATMENIGACHHHLALRLSRLDGVDAELHFKKAVSVFLSVLRQSTENLTVLEKLRRAYNAHVQHLVDERGPRSAVAVRHSHITELEGLLSIVAVESQALVNFELAKAYVSLSKLQDSLGHKDSAIESLKNATEALACQEPLIAHLYDVAALLDLIGRRLLSLSEAEAAIHAFEDSIELVSALRDCEGDSLQVRNGLAKTFSNESAAQFAAGDHGEAIRLSVLAIDLLLETQVEFKDSNAKELLRQTSEYIYNTFGRLGTYYYAVERYAEAAGAWKEVVSRSKTVKPKHWVRLVQSTVRAGESFDAVVAILEQVESGEPKLAAEHYRDILQELVTCYGYEKATEKERKEILRRKLVSCWLEVAAQGRREGHFRTQADIDRILNQSGAKLFREERSIQAFIESLEPKGSDADGGEGAD